PSMTVRNPTTQEMRHHIDGLKGTAPLEEVQFEAGTLLVIEVKTTLGKSKTPGFLKTQAAGGNANVERIQKLIARKKGGWNIDNLKTVTPDIAAKAAHLRNAMSSGKISYLHAQVFFSPDGQLSTLAGSSTGIQINKW
ncbi:hypothetical protein C6A77_25115, partial [Pseudomonas sp. AFG_SD02_1510_Pfu_092]